MGVAAQVLLPWPSTPAQQSHASRCLEKPCDRHWEKKLPHLFRFRSGKASSPVAILTVPATIPGAGAAWARSEG